MHVLAGLLSLALLAAPPAPLAVQEKERGDRLAANGDVAGAREAFENATRLSPGYAAPLNELGILLVGEGRNEEAVALFRKAIEGDPGFALAYNNLGFVLRKQARWAEAIEAYQSYVKLAPADLGGLFGLAEAYRGAGDKVNAVTTYERYLAEPGTRSQKTEEKARATAEQLRRELGAAAPASAAVAAAPAPQPDATGAATVSVPGSAEAPQVVAPAAAVEPAPQPTVAASAPVDAAVAQPAAPAAVAPALQPVATTGPAMTAPPASAPPAGAPVVAQPAAARPPSAYPQPPRASPELQALARQKIAEGLELRAAGRNRDSLLALQAAVNADPSNVLGVLELGIGYAMLNYYPQAIERWERVLSLTTDEPSIKAAQQNIDRARQKMAGMGQTAAQPAAPVAQPAAPVAQPAVPVAQPAPAPVRSAPPSPEAQQIYTAGVALYSQQRFVDARAQFDRAIELAPGFAHAFAARGSAHFAVGDYQRALADYAQAMRLDSTMASPVFGVAETLSALGRGEEAVPYYQSYAGSRATDAQPALQETARQRLAAMGR